MESQQLDLITINQMIEEIVGVPDYAVIFSLWPWPDGGWMAGCVLINKVWAKEQGLLIAKLDEWSSEAHRWNSTDGFEYGINSHSYSWPTAIYELYQKLKMYKEE